MHHLNIDELVLKHGKHRSFEQGACLLEATAYFAGEPFSDAPACVSPVLRAFGISWNDGLRSDEEREQLKPYIPRLVGTAGDPAADERRAWMATDWLVRVHPPAWLRLAGLTDQAAALEGLPELTDGAQIPAIKPVLEAVRRDAAAAWDAAGAAAWDAAGAAAWAAAGDAAGAAAGAAAWAAAGAALAPTVEELQESAHTLFSALIDVGR